MLGCFSILLVSLYNSFYDFPKGTSKKASLDPFLIEFNC